jgi:predicted flap endonuclease-1-like 5' DNA nuclease
MHKTARNLLVLGTGLGISALVGWLFLRESRRSRDDAPVLIKSQSRATEPSDMPNIVLPLDTMVSDDGDESPDTDQTAAETEDDLTRINDIGPRFADALHAIGITSYAQLAKQTPDALAKALTPHVRVTARRIQDKDWVGQAAQFASR